MKKLVPSQIGALHVAQYISLGGLTLHGTIGQFLPTIIAVGQPLNPRLFTFNLRSGRQSLTWTLHQLTAPNLLTIGPSNTVRVDIMVQTPPVWTLSTMWGKNPLRELPMS